MNRFDRKAREAGIDIDSRNGVPAQNRNLRSITDLINAARAAESEVNNKLADVRDELAAERLRNQKVVAEMADLKLEIAELRLRLKVNEGEFTQAQRQQLLESAV